MNLKPPTPTLRSFDQTKAIAFYIDFLGFKIDWTHRFTEDAPRYQQLSRSACIIHLSEHHGDGTPGTKIRIPCDDLDTYLAELTAKDYKYYNPSIVEQSWNDREMSITDPFGNTLIFFQPVE
ncbi:MAG: glyoxalase superfamily protein [Bacteroidota bacterium]